MKRLLIMLCLVAFLVALPMSHSAFAKKPAKVEICHVNSANDILDLGTVVITFGKVIEVSENAVEAHLAHGDSTTFFPMDEDLRDAFEDFFKISLPNANCYF